MKNQLSKEELQELANDTFKHFESAKKVFATLDGNIFIDENRARLHAGVEGTIIPFDRPIEKKSKEEKAPKADKAPKAKVQQEASTEKNSKEDKSPKAEDQIKAILEATTLEELDQFKSDQRVTVQGALLSKMEELSKPTE